MRLALVSGHDDGTSMRAVYLFTAGPPDTRVELHVPLDRARPQVPTLAALSFPASRFERELADLFGIEPLGHPQPRRLVLHQHWPDDWHPMRHGSTEPPEMVADAGSFPFVPVEGTGVYEIPVGPVHAGLIEPGHFRFWVVGETILRMKARLWFVHKGIERLFEGKDVASGLEIAERISGDTAVGHALAYCQAVEDAQHLRVPDSAQILRAVLLELERLYNHVADIGALCNDVGFGLAQAWALDLREQLLQLNREVTGHRLLRGGVVPGGARVRRLPTAAELAEVGATLRGTGRTRQLERPRHGALHRHRDPRSSPMPATSGWSVSSPGRRVSTSTPVGPPVPRSGRRILPGSTDRLGTSWPATRSGSTRCGRPCRCWPTSSTAAGDLDAVVSSPTSGASRTSRAGGVGIAEGWRGAVVHRVELDEQGRLARVKVVDPSFLNWPALPVSLADTIVPDFPLANKSFNLSYAGNDL